MYTKYYNPSTNRSDFAINNIREEAQYLEKVLSLLEGREMELRNKLEGYEFAIEYLRTTDKKVYDRFMQILEDYKSIPF